MSKTWRNYGLGITFVVLWIVAWAVMTWMGWMHYVGEQQQHHQTAEWFGSSGYFWDWGERTFSNWQSEMLGQGLMVILAAYLLFRGSSESKDTTDRVDKMVTNIERRLDGRDQPEPETKASSQEAVGRQTRGNLWGNYSLGIVLIAGFIITWALMTWTGWQQFVTTQHEHGQTAQIFGSSGYIWFWGVETFENWQSDFLQQAGIVILGAYLLYKGSSQSKESEDHIEQVVQRIQQRVETLVPQLEGDAQKVVRETRPVQEQPRQVRS